LSFVVVVLVVSADIHPPILFLHHFVKDLKFRKLGWRENYT
jgi:hypothetical protein